MTDSILQASQIRKAFGGIIALKALSFDVERNRITALIGPNGAGKTTLIDVITGFQKPDMGAISLNGNAITNSHKHEIAYMGIARTFQTTQICDNLTVLENVMLGRHPKTSSGMLSAALSLPKCRREERSMREEAMGYLEMVGLAGLADQAASGVPIGGQKLLEIARALALEPDLLLLDEPAAGLNTQETREVGELIQAIRDRDITVIIVEHDMELVMGISDRILVLSFGELIAEGPPAEIQANPEVVKVYLGEEA